MRIRRVKLLASMLLAGLLIITLLSPAGAASGEGDRFSRVFDALIKNHHYVRTDNFLYIKNH